MLQTVIKLLLSSGIIVIVSEIAKKNTLIGGLIASIPLVSVMAMVWLYIDTKDIENINALSKSILDGCPFPCIVYITSSFIEIRGEFLHQYGNFHTGYNGKLLAEDCSAEQVRNQTIK